MPDEKDRQAIFNVIIKRFKRDPEKFDIKKLSKASEGFTGAEIEQCVISALFRSFSENKEINDKVLLHEITNTTPQSKINEADLNHMRSEAKGKLRLAARDGSVTEVTEQLRNITI